MGDRTVVTDAITFRSDFTVGLVDHMGLACESRGRPSIAAGPGADPRTRADNPGRVAPVPG
jgi:hypothetical protein